LVCGKTASIDLGNGVYCAFGDIDDEYPVLIGVDVSLIIAAALAGV
jgi:hypothetical protein